MNVLLIRTNFSRYTVIDEADEMLEQDWSEELKTIMLGGDNSSDDDHLYLMFSATFPKAARELARTFLANDHVQIKVGRTGSTHGNIKQRIVWVDEDQKNRALYDLLLSLPPARTIIFVNSKQAADIIDDFLFNLDLPSTSIHGGRTQREREDALRAFRKGRAPILVATGVSARGLDIRDVMHVINYDLPTLQRGGVNEYIHRIGRTARIGNIGLATSFYNESNEDIAGALVKTLLETKQIVPDFLEQHIPQAIAEKPDAKLEFSDDSDPEDNEDGKDEGEDEEKKPASISAGDETGKDSEAVDNAGAHKASVESPPPIEPSKFEDFEDNPKVVLDSVAW